MSANKNNYVLIMAGGVGSRFWPKSRNSFPKQFIDILGTGQSLLQMTYERFTKICNKENIYILSNKNYLDLIQDQIEGISLENILLEPSRNNTAPCIAFASYKILKQNPNANIVVAPSDHLILKEDVFLNKINIALEYSAKEDALLTLGISPTRPDTGYGYINFDKDAKDAIHRVNRFMEKPALQKAIEYMQSGDYLWNAGIFIWRATSIYKAFKTYAPEIHSLFEKGMATYNTPEENAFIENNYPLSPNISIDYAILEKATNVFTIPANIGWSDLGTWASLYQVMSKDINENALSSDNFYLEDTQNCIVHLPKNKIAVIKGLDDYIIVDDERVLLIYPKAEEQEIKTVAAKVAEKFGVEYL